MRLTLSQLKAVVRYAAAVAEVAADVAFVVVAAAGEVQAVNRGIEVCKEQ